MIGERVKGHAVFPGAESGLLGRNLIQKVQQAARCIMNERAYS
jgi:hypothetical protein